MAEIPTIPEVLAGVAAGTYSPEQGAVWIDSHIDQQVDAAFDLDGFAALAMQTLMADARFMQEAKNQNQNPREAVAGAAYAQARAMQTARTN